ncbi:MAG: hypothetical protein P1U34_08875 [Coxiellaceae bacterium]|nr:hypothetical protein [Coxiellaceae bacterium]
MTRRKRAEAATPNPYESDTAQANVLSVQQYAESHPGKLTLYKNNTNGYWLLKFTLADDHLEAWYLNPDADKINQSRAKAMPRYFLSGLLRNGSLLECPGTDLTAAETAATPRKRQAIASAGASAKPKSKPLAQRPSSTDQELSLTEVQKVEFDNYVNKWKGLVPNVQDILKHNLRMIQNSPRAGLTYTASEKQGITYYSTIKGRKLTRLSLRPDYRLTEEDCEEHGVVVEDPITYFFSRGAITARMADIKRTMQGFSCPKSTRWADGSISIHECKSNRTNPPDSMTITISVPSGVKTNTTIKIAPEADTLTRDEICRSIMDLYKKETDTTKKIATWNKLSPKDLIHQLIDVAISRKLIQVIGQRSKQPKKKRRIEPTVEQMDNEADRDSNPAPAKHWNFDTELPDGLFEPPMSPMATQAAAGSGQNLVMDLTDEELFALPAEPVTAAGQSLNIAKKTDALVMHWGEQHRAIIAKNLRIIQSKGRNKVQIDFNSPDEALVLKPMIPSAGSQQKINLIPIAPIPDVDTVFSQNFNKARKMLIKLNCAVTKLGNPRHYTNGVSCSAHTKDYPEVSVAACNVTNEEDFLAGKVRIRLTFIGKEGIDIVANGNISDAIHIQRGFIRYYMLHKALMKTLTGTDALNFCFTYATQCPWLSNPSKVERLATTAPITGKRARDHEDDNEEQLGYEPDLLLGTPPDLTKNIDDMIAALGGLDEPPKTSTPGKAASNPFNLWASRGKKVTAAATADNARTHARK